MNGEAKRNTKLKVLMIDCLQNDQCSGVPKDTDDLEFRFAPTHQSGLELLNATKLDCVLVRVDPSSQENLKQLEATLLSANEQGIPLVSMSTFDLGWVENLMAQMGVERHFRQFPSYDEISNTIFLYQKPLSEPAQGVAL